MVCGRRGYWDVESRSLEISLILFRLLGDRVRCTLPIILQHSDRNLRHSHKLFGKHRTAKQQIADDEGKHELDLLCVVRSMYCADS